MSRIILASASPQRRQLLAALGVDFAVEPSRIDERDCPETDPAKRAVELACMKAKDVASRNPDAYVIGSDTLVVSRDGTLLEKPADVSDARRMLRLQSGSPSVVHSAVCIVGPDGSCAQGLSSSTVTFAELSEQDIEWWMQSELWRDRSGSFQIDGHGQLLIAKLEGEWTSVVGLPVFLLKELFAELGTDIRSL
jgi:septum formation protein